MAGLLLFIVFAVKRKSWISLKKMLCHNKQTSHTDFILYQTGVTCLIGGGGEILQFNLLINTCAYSGLQFCFCSVPHFVLESTLLFLTKFLHFIVHIKYWYTLKQPLGTIKRPWPTLASVCKKQFNKLKGNKLPSHLR